MDQTSVSHINYALVEEPRPPLYTAMKYWGKKPHNIWAKFIETYSKPNEKVLDPFAGSALASFEAVQLGRKATAFDLNPLTTFFIESLCAEFDENLFVYFFDKIFSIVSEDPVYKRHFNRIYSGESATIYNFKWTDGVVSEIAYKINKTSYTKKPDQNEFFLASEQEKLSIPYWVPKDKFPSNPSITHKFIKDIGGNTFDNLWTKRNLYILSIIFNEILKLQHENIKLQLLSGFIQTLHLCCKMVVPRDAKSNRDFSGSWGRADYMIRRRSMEQNPLIVFRRSCVEKQSIISALREFSKKFPKGIKINDVVVTKKINPKADINYGSLDIADIEKFIRAKSVDFIITDPPYGGLVHYLDLSLIWLVWLKKYNKKYTPDLRSEITVKRGIVEREEYTRKLGNAFKQMHKVLKDDGYLIVTFHHQEIQEWNTFVRSVKLAGFKFDKVTHQYNRRSGESNVANPYGTSGSDFYIRCVKHREVDFSDDKSGLEHFIVEKSIEIISLRNQPTPYTILITGLIPEMLQAGYFQPEEYKNEVETILTKHSGAGKIFTKIKNNDNKSGDYWWFQNPSKYISYPNLPLNRRVEDTVIAILRRGVSVKYDDILAEIFQNFPNGLTPDPKGVVKLLEKYAYKSADRWKIKEETEKNISKHSSILGLICDLGKKLGMKVFIGRREQPEKLKDGVRLSEKSDLLNLHSVISAEYDKIRIERIEMIDCVWLDSQAQVKCIFEVENSTDFTAAIQRGSNLSRDVQKIMIVPNKREMELKRIKDPYFTDGFEVNNWKYLTYNDVEQLIKYSKVSLKELQKTAKHLNEK